MQINVSSRELRPYEGQENLLEFCWHVAHRSKMERWSV